MRPTARRMPEVADTLRPHPDLVHGIAALRPDHGRLFVVVGVFDGLHLGHLYLLRHLRSAAAEHRARSCVITFDHHPDEILVGAAPALLCDPDERLQLLADAGVDVTVVQNFDADLRMTTFEAFVQQIAERVDLAGFLMTPDAAFGHERRGTPAAVAGLGAVLGYDVVVVPALEIAGHQVRSADIRAAIARGRLDEAAVMLGRAYAVSGALHHADDSRTLVRFPMPVALPPPGEYPVTLRSVEVSPGILSGVTAFVRPDGLVELPHGSVAAGSGHVRVTFDSLPHQSTTQIG